MTELSIPKEYSNRKLRDTSSLISAARTRLDALTGIKRKMAVIRMWPDQAVAEHENVERLRSAAALVGVELIELDRYGHLLDSPGAQVGRGDVDFVLHLHFETAKTYDAISVAAMWNPLAFYFEWGFDVYWPNQMSHDIFAWTGAPEIKKMIKAERGAEVAAAMPLLNHTIAEPIYSVYPHKNIQAFYCGINWEKLDGRPGRHDDVLRALDQAGRLALYGPEKIRDIRVWEDYSCYRGSLPFDGRTVIEKISDAGACLVFSSDAHKASGIMSNRLFEAMSGGAVVIGDEHPFIAEAIGDNYIRVPASWSSQERADAILDALDEMERLPEKAVQLASRAQDALLERYFLSDQIVGLLESVTRLNRDQSIVLQSIKAPLLDVIIQPLDAKAPEIRARLSTLISQLGDRANIIVFADRKHVAWYQSTFGSSVTVVLQEFPGKVILGPADALRAASGNLKTKKCWFSYLIEDIFPEQLLLATAAFKDRAIGRLGHALRHVDAGGNEHFDYRPGDGDADRIHASALAACIFDIEWLNEKVPTNGVDFRQCLKIAELDEQGIVYDQPTSVIVSIKRYENTIDRGFVPVDSSKHAKFGTRVGPKRLPLSGSASVKSYVMIPTAYSIHPRQTVCFGSEGGKETLALMGLGWADQEPTHVWSIKKEAELFLRLPDITKAIRFKLSANPHVATGPQILSILVNGVNVGSFEGLNGETTEMHIDCTGQPWQVDELNRLVFRVNEVATPPKSSEDTRTLGICLWEATVS
jgi:hypothetical protein